MGVAGGVREDYMPLFGGELRLGEGTCEIAK